MELDALHVKPYQDEKIDSDGLSPNVEMAIQHITENDYLNHKIYKRKITTEGGNYLGLLYEVSIEGITAEGKKETNLFIKQTIPSNGNMKLFSISEVYSKEEFAYRELAKIFNKLQNDAQVPSEDRFNMVRFYDESNINALILENMMKKGFETCKKTDVITLKFAELSIQQLAKLHGLSFVMEKKMPEYFQRKIKSIKHSVVFDDSCLEFITKMYDLSSKQLALDVKTRIDKRWKSLLDAYVKLSQGDMTKVKSLCHGDFKMNNVLFKETNGVVTEVVLVDYQFIYYGSPIIDFLCFTFMGTDRKFRRNHLDHLKDVYHDSLKIFLEHFGISVDDIYPRNMFEIDFRNCLNYSLINSIVLTPFLFTTEDETPDFFNEDVNNMGFNVDDRFYDRVNGLFHDFIEWGCI